MISRRFKSLTGQENISLPTSNGTSSMLTSSELEQLKHEILTEVRQEVQKAKAEIIDGNVHSMSSVHLLWEKGKGFK